MREIDIIKIGGRKVEIFIPQDKAVGARPVLFLQDGQNVFNPETSTHGEPWEADDAATFVSAKRPKPIVVAIWNRQPSEKYPSGRYGEYAPQTITESLKESDLQTLNGAIPFFPLTGLEYEVFITKKILPGVFEYLADRGIRHRLDPAGVAIGGSSMGGLSALNLVARHSDAFGTALSFSTHWTMGGKPLARALIRSLPAPESGVRIWLDRGTLDLDSAYAAPDVVAEQELTKLGYRWPQVECRTFVGTGHNEIAWRERLPLALEWWLDGMPSALASAAKPLA